MIDWKVVNERLKPMIIYWVAITALIITMLFMIKDFNRYDAEMNDYYFNLMVDNGCFRAQEDFPYYESSINYSLISIATNVSYDCTTAYQKCFSTKDSSTGIACECVST